MNNNIKEIKTSILGSFMIVIGLLYFIIPYFSERTDLWEVESAWFIGFEVSGVLLLLAPDRIIDFAFGWLNKKK